MEIRGLDDKFAFAKEAYKAKREGRLINFAELPYIKELLPKRRLTGKELGILQLTDFCQRVCQERKGLEIAPLISDTKFRLLRRKVGEVPTYKDEYEEYERAAEILYIQERWASSVLDRLSLKIGELLRITEFVEVAETHTQKLKKNKGHKNAYDKDLEYTEYTLKNIVDDRPEAALTFRHNRKVRDIQRDLYFINGFNKYIVEIAEKLEVAGLPALQLDIDRPKTLIKFYNEGLENLQRYFIKNGKDEETDILNELFPFIEYDIKPNKKNTKAVLMAEEIIDKHNVFTGGYANTVFLFYTDDEAGPVI